MPLISLCATNYNTDPVALRSLESVLPWSDGLDREVVIVDNFSNDGSYEALASYSAPVPMRLARRRCSRGTGRQLAYEMAQGDLIVIFDLDTVYNEKWGQLLRWVVTNRIPFMLDAVYSHFYPRGVLEQVGGWRNFYC